MNFDLARSPPAISTASFRRQILDWYSIHRRDLPWRGDSDPYHILVSEIMLQQTQVDRVVPAYLAFLDRFPTLLALAEASTGDVLRQWQGLGYNRRALQLKKAADSVCRDFDCRLPQTVEELERLPGIGHYTSRAVACFAFGVPVAVVDTNVRRVLSGFAGKELSEKETEKLAEQLLPVDRASDWNQALMDYGAMVYKAKRKASPSTQQPFRSTNRFWRGRIVDALRAHQSLSVPALLAELPYPERDEQRVRGLVRALHEEGMVDYDAAQGTVSLPG